MRRVVLVALCLAAAACGEGETGGESCSRAAVLVWEGEVYTGTMIERRLQRAAPLDDARSPGCGAVPAQSVRVRALSGVPSEVAISVESELDAIYVSRRHWVFLGRPGGTPRRGRGRRCRLDGTVAEVPSLRVRGPRGTRWISVGDGTRFEGFDRGPLPYLEKGDRVRVTGLGCPGGGMVARRIELRP